MTTLPPSVPSSVPASLPPLAPPSTDEAVRPFAATGRLWDAAAGRAATAVTTAALVAVAGLMTPRIVAPALAAAVLAVAGLTFASLTGSRPVTAHGHAGGVLMALAAGCPLPFAVAAWDAGMPLVDALQGGLLLAWVVVWIGVGSARADAGAVRGARVGAGLAVIHLVAALVLPDVAAHAIAALAAVVACGLLPWRALAEAGVASPLQRTPADDDGLASASLRDAFGSLTWAVVAAAATITVAASALVCEGGALPLALALAVLLVVGLRAVTFVDRPQVAALWTAVAVPGLVLLLAGPFADSPVLVALLAVVGVAALVVAGGPRWTDPGRRAALRRVADVVERVAVPVVWVLVLVVVIQALSGKAA